VTVMHGVVAFLHGLIYSILWGGPRGGKEGGNIFVYIWVYNLMEMNGWEFGNGRWTNGDIPNCYHFIIFTHSFIHSNSVFVGQLYD
jgi:hypothetical protein